MSTISYNALEKVQPVSSPSSSNSLEENRYQTGEIQSAENVPQVLATPDLTGSLPLPKWLSKCKKPTTEWTIKQVLYVIVVQGFIAAGISFALNFGIAVAVFKGQDPATMWFFPLPIAGNFGVIAVVEMFIIYNFDGTLMLMDMFNGLIEPLHPQALGNWWSTSLSTPTILPTTTPSSLNNTTSTNDNSVQSLFIDRHHLQWWLRPPELFITPVNVLEQSWKSRIYISCIRSIPWILFGFVLIWPLFTGVSYAIWGNSNYNDYPQPQYISATFGGALILVTNPVLAIISLVYLGERYEYEIQQQQLKNHQS